MKMMNVWLLSTSGCLEAAGTNPEWNEQFSFFVQGTEAGLEFGTNVSVCKCCLHPMVQTQQMAPALAKCHASWPHSVCQSVGDHFLCVGLGHKWG